MQRLISLFKEPEELDALSGPPSSLPASGGQPLYFIQLLEYLRERSEEREKQRQRSPAGSNAR
jgi:hypothetical protein